MIYVNRWRSTAAILKKNKIELLEIKTNAEMENSFGGFNNRLNIVGRISELKDRPIEIIQAKTQRKIMQNT